MLQNYEYRFELKPRKYVYIPTPESRRRGRKIVRDLLDRWVPEGYFYHFGKRGGHIAALRPHVDKKFKASVDLSNFFTSVSRTKVHRSLLQCRYANRHALDIATESCVEASGRKFLPYGFVQSMALATLAVEKSNVGKEISRLRSRGIVITMYVDDIILSSDDCDELTSAYQRIRTAISASNLELAEHKSSEPSDQVEAFNCLIGHGKLEVIESRMQAFATQLEEADDHGRAAILKYVGVLNDDQMKQLEKLPLV